MATRVWKARAAADQDVDDIADHIRAGGGADAAVRFIRSVRDAYELLAEHPRAGPARIARSPHLANLRFWPLGGSFSSYLILYIEREYGVEILRVVHGARDVDDLASRIR
jgi:toxin ParE1/3/4